MKELFWDVDGALVIAGDLSGKELPALIAEALTLDERRPDPFSATLDCQDLELTDGLAVARMVDLIRELARRWGGLCVDRAPQMLAHTLYKPGLLRDGQIRLRAPREDEGTTAN